MSGSKHDAIIVGAGAAGLVFAEALSGAGWKVLVLEEGPWYNPFRDYLREAQRLPLGLGWAADNEIRPSMTKAVGGSTVFYAGVFFRLHESDFQTRTRSGCGADWPLSYEELAPWYDRVEIFTGASGSNTNIFEVPRGPYPNPPHPLSGAAWLFARGARALGLHPAPTPSSILSRPYRGRPGCTYCGMCGQGCMVGDKSSADMTYGPAARKNGADIRPGHRVLTVETNPAGRVTGVVYKDPEGRRERAESDMVILCGGALLNPGLLMRSRGPAHPEGLAARSGVLGRNLMLHVTGRYIARFDREAGGYMGVSGGVNVQDFYEGAKGADFLRGYTVYVSLQIAPPATFADWYLEDSWGEDLVDKMNSYSRTIRMAILGEDQADPENRIFLDPEKKDEDGLPLPLVRYRRSDNERNIFRHAVETCRAACRAGGADDWEIYDPGNSSAHVMGTCRMGDDPEKSVVDRWGACHDVPGLYICDCSVFPTAGSVNPALTVMALAARTSDHLIRRRTG
jgi:choline dehydrogenase-like flavoprotein